MEFKEILISLRKEQNYTQKHMSNFLSMSETGYASWEQGLSEPSISAIKKLCGIFDVSANHLLGIDDTKY